MTLQVMRRPAAAERARAVALFRYSLIREAADPGADNPPARAGWSAGWPPASMPGRSASRCGMSRRTLDRWIRDWRSGGFDALVPAGPPGHPADPGRGARAWRRR